MNTTLYTHRFFAMCPNNGAVIEYTFALTVDGSRMVPVEHIVTACALHKRGFHEVIAADLFVRFGGQQVLTAHHHGVDIKTVRTTVSEQAIPVANADDYGDDAYGGIGG